jgi:hypothetical protein
VSAIYIRSALAVAVKADRQLTHSCPGRPLRCGSTTATTGTCCTTACSTTARQHFRTVRAAALTTAQVGAVQAHTHSNLNTSSPSWAGRPFGRNECALPVLVAADARPCAVRCCRAVCAEGGWSGGHAFSTSPGQTRSIFTATRIHAVYAWQLVDNFSDLVILIGVVDSPYDTPTRIRQHLPICISPTYYV